MRPLPVKPSPNSDSSDPAGRPVRLQCNLPARRWGRRQSNWRGTVCILSRGRSGWTIGAEEAARREAAIRGTDRAAFGRIHHRVRVVARRENADPVEVIGAAGLGQLAARLARCREMIQITAQMRVPVVDAVVEDSAHAAAASSSYRSPTSVDVRIRRRHCAEWRCPGPRDLAASREWPRPRPPRFSIDVTIAWRKR